MSRTYDILCVDCKKALWVGQGRKDGIKYIYRKEKHLKELEAFLFSHMGHRLIFDDDELLDGIIEYETINL